MLSGFGAITLCIQGAGVTGFFKGLNAVRKCTDKILHRVFYQNTCWILLNWEAHQMKQALHKVGLNCRSCVRKLALASSNGSVIGFDSRSGHCKRCWNLCGAEMTCCFLHPVRLGTSTPLPRCIYFCFDPGFCSWLHPCSRYQAVWIHRIHRTWILFAILCWLAGETVVELFIAWVQEGDKLTRSDKRYSIVIARQFLLHSRDANKIKIIYQVIWDQGSTELCSSVQDTIENQAQFCFIGLHSLESSRQLVELEWRRLKDSFPASPWTFFHQDQRWQCEDSKHVLLETAILLVLLVEPVLPKAVILACNISQMTQISYAMPFLGNQPANHCRSWGLGMGFEFQIKPFETKPLAY